MGLEPDIPHLCTVEGVLHGKLDGWVHLLTEISIFSYFIFAGVFFILSYFKNSMYFIFLTSFSSTLPKHLIWCNAHNGFSCKVLDVFSVKRIFSKHRWWARHLDFRITAMRRQSVFSASLQGGERGRRTDSPDTVAALSIVWCTCLRGSYQVNVPRTRNVSTNKGIKTLWSLIISSLLKYATRSWRSQRALAVTHSCHVHRPPAFPDRSPRAASERKGWLSGGTGVTQQRRGQSISVVGNKNKGPVVENKLSWGERLSKART